METRKMDMKTGTPNHIEDYLVSLHPHQWFTWSDMKNKVYANLRLTDEYFLREGAVPNPHSLPTEQECIDGLANMIAANTARKKKLIADKASANQKLKDLGLTDDEIKAITKG